MRSIVTLMLAATLTASAANAGTNRNFLVPFYNPCPGSGTCNPPTRPSAYTFDSIVLSSSQARYIKGGALALAVSIRGLKDAGGQPVTGTVTLRVTNSATISGIGTVGETNPLADLINAAYAIPVTNGNGRKSFKTPPEAADTPIVVNTIGSPIVYDPDGQPLATTGTQTKP